MDQVIEWVSKTVIMKMIKTQDLQNNSATMILNLSSTASYPSYEDEKRFSIWV